MRFCSVLSFVALLVVAPSTWAQPAAGTYTSTDIGGTMMPGRYSISWSQNTGYGMQGNVLNIQSWDGAVFGCEWSLHCPFVIGGQTISDSVDADGLHHLTGETIYSTALGRLTLEGSGPWGGSDGPYDFKFGQIVETVSIVGTDTEILSFTATLRANDGIFWGDTYMAVLNLNAMTRVEVDNTDSTPLHPLDYPPIVEQDCTEEPRLGTWGTGTAIELDIWTVVSTQPTTWGRIKSLYK